MDEFTRYLPVEKLATGRFVLGRFWAENGWGNQKVGSTSSHPEYYIPLDADAWLTLTNPPSALIADHRDARLLRALCRGFTTVACRYYSA
jgi:hypothetical protein